MWAWKIYKRTRKHIQSVSLKGKKDGCQALRLSPGGGEHALCASGLIFQKYQCAWTLWVQTGPHVSLSLGVQRAEAGFCGHRSDFAAV